LDLIHKYEQRLKESATWCAAAPMTPSTKFKKLWERQKELEYEGNRKPARPIEKDQSP